MTELLDKEAVAKLLCCEASTVEAMARDHKLPAIKPGRAWVFPRGPLMERINQLALENLQKPKPEKPVGVAVTPLRGRRKPLPVLPTLVDSGSGRQ